MILNNIEIARGKDDGGSLSNVIFSGYGLQLVPRTLLIVLGVSLKRYWTKIVNCATLPTLVQRFASSDTEVVGPTGAVLGR